MALCNAYVDSTSSRFTENITGSSMVVERGSQPYADRILLTSPYSASTHMCSSVKTRVLTENENCLVRLLEKKELPTLPDIGDAAHLHEGSLGCWMPIQDEHIAAADLTVCQLLASGNWRKSPQRRKRVDGDVLWEIGSQCVAGLRDGLQE